MRDKVRGNLLAKVGVLSALPIVILGVVLGQYLASTVRDRALENARQTATIAARIGIEPLLTRADLVDGLTPDRLASIDATLHKSGVLGSDIARIKIWSPELKVVYSDDASTIGYTFAATDCISPLWVSFGPYTLKNLSPVHCGGLGRPRTTS